VTPGRDRAEDYRLAAHRDGWRRSRARSAGASAFSAPTGCRIRRCSRCTRR
jgi:hypothetical protein